ncbi:hypothetical protein JST97_16030 [bacterium]|nr:hypothetical protein [bacterium]
MKIQHLPLRGFSKLPVAPKADQGPPPPPQDEVAPSRWKKIGRTFAKAASGGALGAIPAGLAGYAISSWGGVPGAVLGGSLGLAVGYLSGKEVREMAEKLSAKDPGQLNFFHKLALKIGPAAPYAWAAFAATEGALAGATFMPAISALCFAKKGMVAGALLMGTKH